MNDFNDGYDPLALTKAQKEAIRVFNGCKLAKQIASDEKDLVKMIIARDASKQAQAEFTEACERELMFIREGYRSLFRLMKIYESVGDIDMYRYSHSVGHELEQFVKFVNRQENKAQ